MPKDDHVEIQGTVIEARGGGQYTVRVEGGAEIRARLGGRMKKNHIRVLPGDTVKVAVSPFDMTHGFITFRSK